MLQRAALLPNLALGLFQMGRGLGELVLSLCKNHVADRLFGKRRALQFRIYLL